MRYDTTFYKLSDYKYTPYSQEQEIEAFKRLNSEKNIEKKKEIRNRIVEHNMKLINSIAIKYLQKTNFFTLDELISYGVEAIIVAIKKYDYTKDVKFGTYATYWIERYISKAVHESEKAIRFPEKRYNLLNRIKKERNNLITELRRFPTMDELEKKTKIDRKIINEILANELEIYSLNIPIDEEKSSTLEDFIPSDIKNPEEYLIDSENLEILYEIINNLKLSEVEIDVFSMRFGLANYSRCYTHDEIAKKYNLSLGKVSLIERKILRAIKHQLMKNGSEITKDNSQLIKKISN